MNNLKSELTKSLPNSNYHTVQRNRIESSAAGIEPFHLERTFGTSSRSTRQIIKGAREQFSWKAIYKQAE